jgi:hypothetical protein
LWLVSYPAFDAQIPAFGQSYLVGGLPTPLKNISQLGILLPIYGK